MERDSRVSEQLDTKSPAAPASASPRHDTLIFAKWRQSGRANNRRAVGPIPPACGIRLRDPVNLGGVEGAAHPSVTPVVKRTNGRSSRSGKEQMMSKTSKEVQIRLSDLTVGDNTWNEMRGGPGTFPNHLLKLQVHDVMKGSDPIGTTRTHIRGGEGWKVANAGGYGCGERES